MISAAGKLGLSFAVLVLSVALLRVDGWFGVGIPFGLILSILYWFDFGRELRSKPPENIWLRRLGLLMGVPQALFGLLCLGSGVAIICWVIYNTFWHRDPHYTGGFLTFGVGPVLTLFGAGWIYDAFRRSPSNDA